MEAPVSDAFVFFGITGDLAFKKIFPVLPGDVHRIRGEDPPDHPQVRIEELP